MAAQSPTYTTVALSGQEAPGTDQGVTYGGFVRLGINANGEVVFEGALSGPGVTVTNDRGIWCGAPGNLKLVAREGDSLPGTGFDERVSFRERDEFLVNAEGEVVLEEDRHRRGVHYRELDTSPSVLLNINDAGQIAFSGTIAGSGVDDRNDSGIWMGQPEEISPVARTGEKAPDTESEVIFSELQTVPSVLLLINEAGHVAFHGRVGGRPVDANNSRGLWAGTPGDMALVARAGSPAVGVGEEVYYHAQPVVGFVLNSVGQVAFLGRLSGPSVDVTNERGLWLGMPGDISLVLREGDPAPGGEEGWSVLSLLPPVINNSGQLAFTGLLTGRGIQSIDSMAMWVGRPDELSIVLRAGTPAPGTGDGVSFYTMSDPVINGRGEIAFKALLRGRGIASDNGRGIWAGSPAALSLVARTGDKPPDTDEGTRYESFGPPLLLNGQGEVAFRAELTGQGVFESNDRGIWAGRPGAVRLIIREGDEIQVAPGDVRTVEVLSFGGISGGEDGRNTSYNDAGQIAFNAYFTNGTRGVFVANPR